MKLHRPADPIAADLAETALYAALRSLQSTDECRRFFRDLCTPAEIQALSDRWTVVGLLEKNLPYREIARRTGVSVTTIGRVARALSTGHGGYDLARSRLGGTDG